ncbi:hypothetical protein [Halomonas caseinilytica]|uniref:Uncharacterized protein n=1 Tax=Halomonas caseinilytica TaxID=438744 RepID=A0A1M6UFC0_9GAMM|nr:hypothetical protein [Halomonas caseinilytica]SHK67914.1 hypothetical protein SAMN05192556_104249 [Halomonas caseinilytica]
MSHYTKIDPLFDQFRDARDAAEAKLREALPPGSRVMIQSGPEWIGPYEVLEYPRLSFGQLHLRNVETGAERRVGYAQTKPV